MKQKIIELSTRLKGSTYFWIILIVVVVSLVLFFIAPETVGNVSYQKGQQLENFIKDIKGDMAPTPVLDKEDYDRRMTLLANNPPPPAPTIKKVAQPDGTFVEELVPAEIKKYLWPVQTEYPKVGAILPFNRVVAYYGNLYSKKMGALGEYEEADMLARLDKEVKKWELVDPETPVVPALHYIAIVAQGSAGQDGKYRFRMPDSEIQKVFKMAEKVNAIVFLDLQVALSDLQTELPVFRKYLELPHVHLGIDPEFSMKTGKKPGSVVGTFDAVDINFATNYLSEIVKEKDLPPKILVIHRFTQKMVTNYQNIKIVPEVQIVMHMDGWGHQARKMNTYKQFVHKEPVQFTGFKIFYKNDLKEENSRLVTPEELMKLNPRPIYIQYQ